MDVMALGEWRDGKAYVTVCPSKCSDSSWEHCSLPSLPALWLSAGTAVSRSLGFITPFIQAEEDCAASAVTLTDVCTSQAEWTCCSYILTEVSHRKNQNKRKIPIAQPARVGRAGGGGGRNQQFWAAFSLWIAISNFNRVCRHSLCCFCC